VGLVLAAMTPILPQLADVVGGRETAEFMVSLASFGIIAGGMLSGAFLGRLGIRRSIIAALLLYALSAFGGVLWPTALMIGSCRFLLGVAAVLFSSAAVALTARRFSGAHRSRVIGIQQASSQAANIMTVFAVGALARFYGWRSAFLLLGFCAALLCLIAVMSVSRVAPPAQGTALQEGAKEGLGRDFWRVCVFALLFGILGMVPFAQLPFLLVSAGVGGGSWIPSASAACFVLAALGAVIYATAKTRLGVHGVFLLGLCLESAGVLAMGTVHTKLSLLVASAIAGLGMGFGNTFVFDHGIEVVAASQHGRAAGLLFSFLFLGTAVNPLVLIPFETLFGQRGSLVALAVASLAVGLIGLTWRRPRPPVVIASKLTTRTLR